jgi:predicted AAA+ superfamily ATPase
MAHAPQDLTGGNMGNDRRDVRSKAMAQRSSTPDKISSAKPATDDVLERIADALERLAPPPPAAPDFVSAEAFVWHPDGRRLAPVARVNRV